MYTLVIGNRNYSSWSLRAWLYLRLSEISFDEIRIPLFTGSWQEEIARYSPAGRVPVLLDEDLAVWDSLAIVEYIRERHTDAISWPLAPAARAHAWSIVAEMHSGFMALRDELPQNIRAQNLREWPDLSEVCRSEIQRINEIWGTCRRKYRSAGPWLFGSLSIADIMFAPVALRFATYSIPLPGSAGDYVRSIQDLDLIKEWSALSEAELESLEFIDKRTVPVNTLSGSDE
ncbi:MAG: glutathione S-transferase family protein [Gammaproteobacteria bacterium]|nr:glutathione S-transferase family protein [Gammaproteobacteria bacterium]